jgi:hypothetical protein
LRRLSLSLEGRQYLISIEMGYSPKNGNEYKEVVISKNRMDEENHFPQTKMNQKLTLRFRLERSWPEALESELRESLNKLDHRAEILIAISDNQRAAGCYELAEAYGKQAMKLKAYTQPIWKLLMSLA